MNHYVTLFDGNFLPQGLALHGSLRRHARPFTLWVLCVDDNAEKILRRIRIPEIRIIPLSSIENPALARVKHQRNRAEFCWTLTPLTPKIVFDRDPSVERVTYLDADMYFLGDPSAIHHEFERSGKSVLITDHAYDAGNDRSLTSGRYCVQFMTFVRTRSDAIRSWWEGRCMQWRFVRGETGRFSDQKYLDDWPSRFPDDVHVLGQLDALRGPWNAKRFSISTAVAWHFHGLRVLGNGKFQLHPGYSIPSDVEELVYIPYVAELRRALDAIGEPIAQEKLVNLMHVVPPWIRAIGRRGLKYAREFRR